ncbi:MAG: hypothetical protein ACJ739_06535 [Acidimicrobiales bacterium]
MSTVPSSDADLTVGGEPSPSTIDRLERPGIAVGLCVVVFLPFALLGYGTDIDVAAVLAAGHRWLDHGEYAVSRVPGAAAHEVTTAFLDQLGGSVLVNVASVLFAGLALWGVQALLRHERSRTSGLAVLVLATNPWFWIAATSLGDFVWALGLLLAGAVTARRDHRVVSGLLFGLAIGCRLSSVFLVAAWLLAEVLGRPRSRVAARSTAITAGVALAAGALCFVPSWLWADRTLDFLHSTDDFAGLRVHLGRWAIKNAAFFGVLAGIVLLIGLPRLRRLWPSWHTSVAFRFALLALIATEVLYLRFPFKMVHLLPAGMALALVVGHLGIESRRWLGALIAAQLVGGLVTTTLAAPDVEDRATSGQIELGITEGPLLTDVQCRLDDQDDGAYDDAPFATSMDRSAANARCLLQTWRASP